MTSSSRFLFESYWRPGWFPLVGYPSAAFPRPEPYRDRDIAEWLSGALPSLPSEPPRTTDTLMLASVPPWSMLLASLLLALVSGGIPLCCLSVVETALAVLLKPLCWKDFPIWARTRDLLFLIASSP